VFWASFFGQSCSHDISHLDRDLRLACGVRLIFVSPCGRMPFCRFPMGGNAAILDLPAVGLVLDVNRLSAIYPGSESDWVLRRCSAVLALSIWTSTSRLGTAVCFFKRWVGTRAGGAIDCRMIQRLRIFYVS
jgi:hypothetical protein